MIKRLEKLIGNKGEIIHHVIADNEERFFIELIYDYDDNESFWKNKIINEFSPRKTAISFTINIYINLSIEKSIKIDRDEKLKNLNDK